MRHARRKGHMGQEFGGSGEDSFVAVVVTKLTGALLFILLLTMVIMALIPKAEDAPNPLAENGVPENSRPTPLAITTPDTLPEAIAGRPYVLALAATGGQGPLRWSVVGELPKGLRVDPEIGRIEGTATEGTPQPTSLTLRVTDGVSQVTQPTRLVVYRSDQPLTLPSWLRPRFPILPWRAWLEQGFGFLLLALVHLVGMNTLSGLQRWVLRVSDESNAMREILTRRFAYYRISVRMVSLIMATGLGVWIWRTGA
ncbi:MAG: Ig domain-containing protein [Isosphaeraceae bacterium]